MENNFKLLSESVGSYDVEILNESFNGKKSTYIEGIYAQADIPNHNRRVYPSKILMPATESYIDKYVNDNRAIGLLDHPPTPETKLKEASHLITEMKIEGSNVIGKAKIFSGTENGKIALHLIEEGVKFGVSTRGLGSVIKGRSPQMVESYRMTAVDIVANPSAPDSFVKGIMESCEYMVENDIFTKVELEKIHKTEKEDRLKLFMQLIRKF